VSTQVFTWDWRASPPVNEIVRAALAMASPTACVYSREVSTGGDSLAWVVADHPVTDAGWPTS
jgi:hypothetical protein